VETVILHTNDVLVPNPPILSPVKVQKSLGVLGKRKRCLLHPLPALPKMKKQFTPSSSVGTDEWAILSSNAKQPNLNLIKSRQWKVQNSDLAFMNPAKPKTYSTTAQKLGAGTYGIVYQIADVATPSKPLVMKLTKADMNFFNEISALTTLNRTLSSPCVPKLHDWFVVETLPTEGNWALVSEKVRSRFYKQPQVPFGIMVIEQASGGSLSSFCENYLDTATLGSKEKTELVTSVMFQLIFNAAALPESKIVHRDISGTNILVKDGSSLKAKPYFQSGEVLFAVPKNTLCPLLIDYGSANILEIGSSMKTNFRFTTLRYRPPEMIFLSCHPSGKIQPSYTPAADLFSLGLCLLEMNLGNFTTGQGTMKYQNHPFLRHKPPASLKTRLSNLIQEIKGYETDASRDVIFRSWCATLRKGFIDDSEISQLARYLWGMYYELGVPDDSVWPGVEQTYIWQILDETIKERRAKNLPCPSSVGRMFQNCNMPYLSEAQLDVILSMLKYDPKNRPSASDLLETEAFDNLRINSHCETILDPSSIWTIAGLPL